MKRLGEPCYYGFEKPSSRHSLNRDLSSHTDHRQDLENLAAVNALVGSCEAVPAMPIESPEPGMSKRQRSPQWLVRCDKGPITLRRVAKIIYRLRTDVWVRLEVFQANDLERLAVVAK